ncbi:MAG TPA: phosphomethylpyrimidine synthase ThiC, partial [Nitrospiraceae bacterium]|nr:phosphomethylpyrimidine synthase ThiC [Nitrospiraceae bacterium]
MSSLDPTKTASSGGNGESLADSTFMTQPFPASRKVYVEGTMPGVRVPMREISLSPTRMASGGGVSPNPSITLYDTSGPYTDPDATIDIRAGLAPQRRSWIVSRNDVEELPHGSSLYGRLRAADSKLAGLRFKHIRKPLRAKPGMNVTQMHYARKGIITPEMEYIAVRENQAWELAHQLASSYGNGGEQPGDGAQLWVQHPGHTWGASIPS